MPDKQHTFGQFETPPDVADLLLGFCMRRPFDRILDPSCGEGALLARAAQWQQWLADSPQAVPADRLWGCELDPDTAVAARTRLPHAAIHRQNFFTMQPDPGQQFDAVIGNPPYTRAEWIGRLPRDGRQLTLPWSQPEKQDTESVYIPPEIWHQLDNRTGLYAYFFLHSLSFLREGGRLGFVVPNGWLGAMYGESLKRFLLNHFRLIALIESTVEQWFAAAKVNTCLLILERCDDAEQRHANLIRFVQLQRPLTDLIPLPADTPRRPQAIERLVMRLLPGQARQTEEMNVRVLAQSELKPGAKWRVALQAPPVYRKRAHKTGKPLRQWTRLQRGYTTGANEFFYLDEAAVAKWGIEAEYRRPFLKSLRGINNLQLDADVCRRQLLCVPPTADLRGTAVADYIAWGESEGFHQRRTVAQRRPWYSLPAQEPGRLVLPKGIWRRHSVPLLAEALPVDQQLYLLRPAGGVDPAAAAALLNSAWFILQCELRGRVSFGAGVLWLAAYEVSGMRLPDPRSLTAAQQAQLKECFAALAKRPQLDVETELNQPERQALDAVVFDLLGFTAGERTAVVNAIRDQVQIRRRRAANS